jgi:hypothetical protein
MKTIRTTLPIEPSQGYRHKLSDESAQNQAVVAKGGARDPRGEGEFRFGFDICVIAIYATSKRRTDQETAEIADQLAGISPRLPAVENSELIPSFTTPSSKVGLRIRAASDSAVAPGSKGISFHVAGAGAKTMQTSNRAERVF